MKQIETGRTVGGIKRVAFFCSVCLGDIKLERIKCGVTSSGSIFKMSSNSESWLVMLRCPQCGILYAVNGYVCDNY